MFVLHKFLLEIVLRSVGLLAGLAIWLAVWVRYVAADKKNWTDLYALHAWSLDGRDWHVATYPPHLNSSIATAAVSKPMPSLPWSKTVEWANGTRYVT